MNEENVPLDEEQLAHFVRQLARDARAIDESPKTEQLFIGEEARPSLFLNSGGDVWEPDDWRMQ